MDNKWHIRFYQLASIIATWSKDPEVKVGAVVIHPSMRLMSSGYNGFPHGIADTPERLGDKTIKNNLMVHAEMNAMDNADQSIRGWILYSTRACCHMCALHAIRKGIVAVFTPEPDPNSSWFESQQLAIGIFTEANIVVNFIKQETKQ